MVKCLISYTITSSRTREYCQFHIKTINLSKRLFFWNQNVFFRNVKRNRQFLLIHWESLDSWNSRQMLPFHVICFIYYWIKLYFILLFFSFFCGKGCLIQLLFCVRRGKVPKNDIYRFWCVINVSIGKLWY